MRRRRREDEKKKKKKRRKRREEKEVEEEEEKKKKQKKNKRKEEEEEKKKRRRRRRREEEEEEEKKKKKKKKKKRRRRRRRRRREEEEEKRRRRKKKEEEEEEETKCFPLNADLNPIFHLLSLLGAHHILHVSRIRVFKRQISIVNVLWRQNKVWHKAFVTYSHCCDFKRLIFSHFHLKVRIREIWGSHNGITDGSFFRDVTLRRWESGF